MPVITPNQFVYPAPGPIQNRIPLWLKFFCHEYSNNSAVRSNAAGVVGSPPIATTPLLASIFVPAPSDLSTYANVNYNTERKDNDTLANPVDTFDKWAGAAALGSLVLGPGIAATIGAALLVKNIGMWVVDKVNKNFLGSTLEDMDLSDTKFQGVSKRVYTFKLLMPALQYGDSEAASAVAKAFQAYQLPTALLYPYAQKMRHPPLWRIGVGNANDAYIDNDWSNQPQWCLLSSVTVNKTAFKNNYAVQSTAGNDNNLLKPLAQSVTLEFVELEPNLRSSKPGSTDVISRSTSFYNAGGVGELVSETFN
jgi:hypothetical protein